MSRTGKHIEIDKYLKNYIIDMQNRGRKRFNLADAQERVAGKAGGRSAYEELGGYNAFYAAVERFYREGLIMPVKSSEYNGMAPPLQNRWSVASGDESAGWPDSFILQVSDLLDMSGYLRNPDWQTGQERLYIESIHAFLQDAEKREWASCEERCLELFGYEKFLSTEERRVLTRLHLTYDQLKMRKYGQMFSYWTGPRGAAKQVIILENHSTFFSFKRCAEKELRIFSLSPGLLIFGDGKSIVKSLAFLDEIANAKNCEIKYFGDIDPEGWLIYKSLCGRYPELDISLLLPAYAFLLNSEKSYPIGDVMQSTDNGVLEYITAEFEKSGGGDLNHRIAKLWEERRRVPQELLTFEKLKGMAGLKG